MTDIATLQAAAHDPVPALWADLTREFGEAADRMLMTQVIEAEAADFHWEARVDARRMGAIDTLDGEDEARDCYQILGYLDGQWFVATLVVDRESQPLGMWGASRFASAWDAYEAFEPNA